MIKPEKIAARFARRQRGGSEALGGRRVLPPPLIGDPWF